MTSLLKEKGKKLNLQLSPGRIYLVEAAVCLQMIYNRLTIMI